jgi:cytochrome P450
MRQPGPTNCVGRALAMNEMRAVLGGIVRRFNVRLADGFDPSTWEAQLKDRFVLARGPLPVVMTHRK